MTCTHESPGFSSRTSTLWIIDYGGPQLSLTYILQANIEIEQLEYHPNYGTTDALLLRNVMTHNLWVLMNDEITKITFEV